MSEPLIPLTPTDADGDFSQGSDRRRLYIMGGVVGAAVVAGVGGFLLLSGGSSDGGSVAFTPTVHHAAASASPSASASASASDESVLPVYHGSVGDRDPFAQPAAIVAALSPAPVASAAAPAAAASASPAAAGVTVTGVGGVPVVTTSTAPDGMVTTIAASPAPPSSEYLQLLSAHHVDGVPGGWEVTVRSSAGIATDVKPGTKNVDGTLFFYQGEDETAGKPTFVFSLGESKGGNLVPNNKENAKNPVADKSTVVLKDGNVDGGIYDE